MSQTFYSNGKLLLTGEYAVLDGAKALALPTKFGQDLVVESGKDNTIHWRSFDHNGAIWFEETIDFEAIKALKSSPNPVRNTLIKILHEALALNRVMLENDGFTIETHLDFPRNWGLGTSSTLINNIAQWFKINAYELLRTSFGGSGYDIACAQHDTPIVYRLQHGKPLVTTVDFSPSFKSELYFVYLNQKQSSREAIAAYKQKENKSGLLAEINAITEAVLQATDANTFATLLEKHENTMAEILQANPVNRLLFPDFRGTIKSLGAWGGDFVLVVSDTDPTAYFSAKGYETIISYANMIL